MDSRYRFLTLGSPWTQTMLSLDVNAATGLVEASRRHDDSLKTLNCLIKCLNTLLVQAYGLF